MINKQFKFEEKNTKWLSLNPKVWVFQGQFDVKDQGQGDQFSNLSETFR